MSSMQTDTLDVIQHQPCWKQATINRKNYPLTPKELVEESPLSIVAVEEEILHYV